MNLGNLSASTNRELAGTPRLEDCWAKTNPQTQLPALSVRDHCIQVGAVGFVAQQKLPMTVRRLIPSGGITLIAAHDIGKITPGFLMKSPFWREQWQKLLRLGAPDSYESNHAKVSQQFLASISRKPLLWLLSVGGHHGAYCSRSAQLLTLPFEGNQVWVKDLKQQLLAELVGYWGNIPELEIEKSARLHWFTGFMTFCDWIGSNAEWFPLSEIFPPTLPVTEECACAQAHKAIDEIGWNRWEVIPLLGFPQLFRTPNASEFRARPLQEALLRAVDTSGLYIVEAPMGDGKTEAALAAAYRRWTLGGERGLYFALPTQLTSNRIHKRIESFLTNVVSDRSTLTLAHGNAWLLDNRVKPLRPVDSSGEEAEIANEVNRWFCGSRTAMLAPFGVGTIDQALMAAMPVKFSATRLFALGGKVIVIDEVHSYDPYTSALLDRAVAWLLDVGCTVIILSATLTQKRRSELTKAAGAKEAIISNAYPLITKVATDSKIAESIEIAGAKPTSRSILIQNLKSDSKEWVYEATQAVESGACVLIVRNTIALAQQTYREVRNACRDNRGIEFGLLHSRFTQADRNKNEEDWMTRLGKGQEQRPARCILVGTQVVEQSVDIDADLLITDLAPTDLLFQRIGRLHRHNRPRPKHSTEPRCIVLQPDVDWLASEKQIKTALGSSAYVYPPFTLYMSQYIWSKKESVMLPDEIRPMLELSTSVPDGIPIGARRLKTDFDDQIQKQISVALGQGVFVNVSVNDLEGKETRWNPKPTGFVVLLKTAPKSTSGAIALHFLDDSIHTLRPGTFDFQLARLLQLNAVRIPRYLVADHLSSHALPDWLQQHLPQSILAYRSYDTNECTPWMGTDTPAYRLFYSKELGLTHEKAGESKAAQFDEEDSWF